jgi:hypothetical protein
MRALISSSFFWSSARTGRGRLSAAARSRFFSILRSMSRMSCSM